MLTTQPQALREFLYSMPKGGDLHIHESGAVLAENMVVYAQKDNFCVNTKTYSVYADATCAQGELLSHALTDSSLMNNIMRSWSMYQFTSGAESGHDHFFATFGKFSPIAKSHRGEFISEIAERAAEQNELYLEIMQTLDGNASGMLGNEVGFNADFDVMRDKLLIEHKEKFTQILASMRKNMDDDDAKMHQVLACGSNKAKKGCGIKLRYLYQVARGQQPQMVFAQLLAGFEIANIDSRVVGINMVQPEDGEISMRDYKLHMEMVGYLHKLYPNVNISLHAGEITSALVPADGLRFHIRDAVNVAHAQRIGHGVDIASEDDYSALLSQMAQDHVLVEINLSSNEMILGVAGKNHPLPLYMQYHVPIALSTDDEGVSREDLTTQYQKAVSTYHLTYSDLKNFSRNSITYGFIPGKSLWSDSDYEQVVPECSKEVLGTNVKSSACNKYLKQNEKASMQWELERRFAEFESHF